MKHYSPQALERARRLRRTSTDTERALWQLLRSRGLAEFKFRRQQPIAGYIADFACLERGLIIELDGGHHPQQEHHDAVRTRKLQDAGFRVLRFWDNDVLTRPEAVLVGILSELGCHVSATAGRDCC